MALSPTLTAFLRQIRGDASGGVTGLLTDIPVFNAAIEELAAGGGTSVDWQEEGATIVASAVANFVGAGVTVTDVGGVATITIPGGGGGGGIIQVTHEEANNVFGGGTTGGIFNIRPLNTLNKNTIVGASLATDQITLPAGDYVCRSWQMAYRGNRAKARLRDITNSVTVVNGASHFMLPVTGDGQAANVPCDGFFTLAGTVDLELQLFVLNDSATAGLGFRADSGEPEVYALIEIEEV